MPEIEHSVEIDASTDRTWRFVEVLPNWAPYLVGFRNLEIVDDRTSLWTLRGDLGILSREVVVRAEIVRWDPGARVDFTISGVTESLTGGGSFVLAEARLAESGHTSAAPPAPGWFRRAKRALMRRMVRRVAGRRGSTKASVAADVGVREHAVAGPRSRLTFTLQVKPGGAMAPMAEMLMGPMMQPAAEELANGIRQALSNG